VGFLPKKASRAEEEKGDLMVEAARKEALVADFCASAWRPDERTIIIIIIIIFNAGRRSAAADIILLVDEEEKDTLVVALPFALI
jgi:hypothetical protein